jgi:hypothetical protein
MLDGVPRSSTLGEWSVVSPSGRRNLLSPTRFDGARPGFAQHQPIQSGECRNGWLVGAVPSGMQISALAWHPDGHVVAEWII